MSKTSDTGAVIPDLLATLREAEIARVVARLRGILPAGSRVLEVGAGTGWQALRLQQAGYRVEAIDLAGGPYAGAAEFPVRMYDGHHVPFEDASFDLVFSSNVLEHIPHVEAFQAEVRRVLRPDGLAVHVLPSATWRLWSWLAHYAWVAKVALATRVARTDDDREAAHWRDRIAGMRWHERLRKALLPSRHGEHGNALTEIAWFSRWRWLRLFRRTGFELVAHEGVGLFYSNYTVAGSMLGIPARARLARWLGSSTRIYTLRRGSRAVATP